MDKKIQVLVTGVGGAGNGEQVMFALRAAKTPYRIIGTDMDPYSLGLHTADKGYVVPRATDERYVINLLRLCALEKVKAIIPGSEAELIKISETRDVFRDNGVIPLINDEAVINLCLNKWETYLFLRDTGFNVPKSYLPDSTKAMYSWDLGSKLGFPVIVKPYLGTGGSRFVFVAQNEEELTFFVRYLRRNGNKPMIQRYVDFAENEFTIGVLTSFEGELMGSIALKRNLSSSFSTLYRLKNYRNPAHPIRISTGISQGVIDDFPEIRKNAEELALKLGSRGPLNIQCRVVDGKSFVFEINPRFSGTESLRALAGYNAPDALIRKYVLGEEIDRLTFRRGRASRGLANHFVASEASISSKV